MQTSKTALSPQKRSLRRLLLASLVVAGIAYGALFTYGLRMRDAVNARAHAAKVREGLRQNEMMHGGGQDCRWDGVPR